MRKIFILFSAVVFAALSLTPCSAEVLSPQTKITRVSVYPGAARITRQAQVDLSEGEHTVVFDNIVPMIDQDSLAIAGEGSAQVKLYGASFKVKQLAVAADARISDLEAQIEAINDEITLQNIKMTVSDQQKAFINSIKLAAGEQVPKDLMTKMPAAQDLGGIFDFIGTSLQNLGAQQEAIRLDIRKLEKQKDVLDRQLSELRGGSTERSKRSIEVELACQKAGTFTVEASYMVMGPSWRPVYDARAGFNPAQVEMVQYAMVQQNTGEDWADVDLTLSTVQPLLGGRMPYVDPWVLRPVEPVHARSEGRGMMMKSVADDMSVQYEAYSAPNAVMQLAAGGVQPAEVSYANVEQKGVSVVFKIARPISLACDGTERKFPVTSQMLKTDYEYTTFPKAANLAYLGSRAANTETLNLLGGEVNLFVDGDYIGKSSIDNIGPGETFDLYLGADENVKVKREMVSKEMDKTLFANIAASTFKVTYVYKLTVENYKPRDIKVKLFEAMPVSQDDRIKIKVFDVSAEPTQKDWKDRQGVWLWEFSLKPKEKKEVRYSFVVEHPKNLPLPEID